MSAPHSAAPFDALHPVLARQLRRHLRGANAATVPADLLRLIEAVSEAYHDADDERRLMASTIEATSAELVDRHERLEVSERGYRELFESNPWPLLVCDPATLHIIAVNATAVERYGYTRDTLCALRLDELGPDEDADGAPRLRFRRGRRLDASRRRHATRYGHAIAWPPDA